MTPHRVLVVQSSRPLRVAMGHASNALRSRNSAYLAPRPASERQMRLDAGRCASQKTTERLRLSWVVTVPGTRYCTGTRLPPVSLNRYSTGKKTPGGAGTHTGHTGHTGARGHTDHTDEPHNHPLKSNDTPARKPRPTQQPQEQPQAQSRPLPASIPVQYSESPPSWHGGEGGGGVPEKCAILHNCTKSLIVNR